jgi:hypothetical protein
MPHKKNRYWKRNIVITSTCNNNTNVPYEKPTISSTSMHMRGWLLIDSRGKKSMNAWYQVFRLVLKNLDTKQIWYSTTKTKLEFDMEHLSKPQTHDSRQHLNERNCILTWRWIHILVYGERQISIAAWMWIRIFAIEEEPNSRYHFLNQSTTCF